MLVVRDVDWLVLVVDVDCETVVERLVLWLVLDETEIVVELEVETETVVDELRLVLVVLVDCETVVLRLVL